MACIFSDPNLKDAFTPDGFVRNIKGVFSD